jgi:cobalt/nickel transport system permease protein
MHLPDNFLSTPIALGLDVAAVGVLALASRRARQTLGDADAPLMGLFGAFIFAAQMINLPVAGGTSGHLLGGVLVASLLGPAAGTIVMAAVFVIQCLLFQDGGLLAIGANFLNMGAFGTIGGYYLLKLGLAVSPKKLHRAVIFGVAWLTIVLASAVVAVELWLSGQATLTAALVAMLSWHVLIGLIEGAVTVGVLSLIAKARPTLLEKHLGVTL